MSASASTAPALPLFVYGTLRSGERAAPMLDADVVRRAPARVSGRLVDTGQVYPGAVFEHTYGVVAGETYPGAVFESAQDVVEGELVWLRPATYAAALERLDAYEGAPTLFQRVMVVAETGGERLEAFAYEWLGRMG